MKDKNPLVSILLPVQNASSHIAETLDSILSQKYTNFEVIAVDDDSSDQTLKIIRKYKKKDPRIRIYKNLNRYGLRKSLNIALRKSKGELIAFMPEHGKNYVDRLSKQISFLHKNPNVGVIGAQCSFVNKNNKIISKTSLPTHPEKLEANLVKGGSFIFGSLMVNKLALPKDLLRFEHEENPQMFASILIKASKYAKVANLEEALIFCPEDLNPFNKDFDMEGLVSHVKAWAQAVLVHEYRPSLRSLLTL